MSEIYGGHGACELCGEIDPCMPCAGAWANNTSKVRDVAEKAWIKKVSEITLSKENTFLKPKSASTINK
jgi:hypothetical protein